MFVVETEDLDEYILQKLLSHHWFKMYIQYYFERYILNADNVSWYYYYLVRVNKYLQF